MKNGSTTSKQRRKGPSPVDQGRVLLDAWTDEGLMSLVCNRDEVAFAEIFRRHHAAAFARALRICGERSLAEDAVQEAFLSLWRSCASYDARRGNLRSWVLTIVHNRAIDLLRRGAQERFTVSDEDIAERVESPESTELEADRREQAHELRCAMELLPAEQHCALRLAYFGGYTHAEVAAMLDAPVGTVKGRMRLGVQKLRAQLAPGIATA